MGMQTMLDKEIESEFEVLQHCKPGDETHKATVDSLTKLMDRAIETDLKVKQMQDEKKDRFIKNLMSGVRDAAMIGVAVWGTVASMNFEREGTITTSAGRKHLNKVLSLFK